MASQQRTQEKSKPEKMTLADTSTPIKAWLRTAIAHHSPLQREDDDRSRYHEFSGSPSEYSYSESSEGPTVKFREEVKGESFSDRVRSATDTETAAVKAAGQ